MMSHVIHKFALGPPGAAFIVGLPDGAQVLAAQLQGDPGLPVMWVQVEVGAPTKPREFILIGTGQTFPPEHWRYHATFQMGRLVWHLFERATP